MLSYFLDEHVGAAVAAGLRLRGIQAVTAAEAGRRTLDDQGHIVWCAERGLVLVTTDTDFIALHVAGVTHAGIVWTPNQRRSVGELIRRLEALALARTPEGMANTLEYV
ncbi:MAG: DUF5615 family PIN-like protein [Dehalococcoidia bacterium]